MCSVAAHFAMFQHFSEANNGGKARGEGGFGFLGDGFVGFAKELAPLGMADNDVAATGFDEHLRRDFAGKGAFFFPKDVLSPDGDLCAASGLDGGMNSCERRSDDDVALQ